MLSIHEILFLRNYNPRSDKPFQTSLLLYFFQLSVNISRVTGVPRLGIPKASFLQLQLLATHFSGSNVTSVHKSMTWGRGQKQVTSYTDGNFSLNRPTSEIYRKCNVEILASLASVQMIAPCQTVVNFTNILRATFVQ